MHEKNDSENNFISDAESLDLFIDKEIFQQGSTVLHYLWD